MKKLRLGVILLFGLFLFLIGFVSFINRVNITSFVIDVPTNITTESQQHSWLGNKTIQSAELDSTHNLIYFVGGNGLFGFYNITSNTTTDLSGTDNENWIGNQEIRSLAVDSTNDLVYLLGYKYTCGSVLGNNLFGVYNRTSNITENLNTTDNGDWLGPNPQIGGIVVDSSTHLAYFRGISGFFGVYNRTSNTSENLNVTLNGFTGSLCEIIINQNNNLIYLGGGNGAFGAYNRTSNVTENLTMTSSFPNFGARNILSFCIDSSNNLIYLTGSGAGVSTLFSVYNVSKNVTENLNMTGDVIPSAQGSMNDCVFDSNNKLVYIIGAWSAFGVYNRTSNTTENLNKTDTGNWIGAITNNLVFDSNRSLIYLSSNTNSYEFGVYNRTSNVTENLNDSDTGDWLGTNDVNEVIFNSNNKLLYFVGTNGVFGAYNRTLNKSDDLNLPNDWFRFNAVKTIVFNSLNNLIYLGGVNGRFGTYNYSLNEKQDLRNTDPSGCFYSKTISEMTHDSTNNLIYLAGSSFLCSFNISSNITEDLRHVDGTDLIVDVGISSLTFDTLNSLVYYNRGTTSSGFFSYNVSANTTENLAQTDSGGWLTTVTNDMTFDSTNNLIYLVGNTGQFGVYNVSKNETENLNKTDSDDWIKTTNLLGVTYDSSNRLIYLDGANGAFGVYNRDSNQTENLNLTDTGNWVNNLALNEITFDNNSNLVYFVGYFGAFGVYNRTSNVTEDLRGTDSGDWIGNTTLNIVSYSSRNNLVYIGGEVGLFGVYNRTSNSTTEAASVVGEVTSPRGSSSPPSQTTIIPSITLGTPAIIEITSSSSSIRTIKINAKNNMSNVTLTLSRTNISDADFQVIAGGRRGESYEAYNINFTGNNSDIANVTIGFRVNKTWLIKTGFTTSNIALYRELTNSTRWKTLATTFLSEDLVYYYFSAVSPGFSKFLIFIGEDECIPAEKRCVENEVQFCLGNKKWLVSEVCDYKCVNGACVEKGLQVNLNPLVVYPIIGIVVVGILISFLVQRMPKRKKDMTTHSISNYFRRIGKR
ncbi:MAG: PGF-pre-PGF domain-containing protein [Nanoarchaeota archaeon]|nr:PGF-pre-PGF domain-containing protein [Nanoarchaeota archaeon]